jgi:hypothetical protein
MSRVVYTYYAAYVNCAPQAKWLQVYLAFDVLCTSWQELSDEVILAIVGLHFAHALGQRLLQFLIGRVQSQGTLEC